MQEAWKYSLSLNTKFHCESNVYFMFTAFLLETNELSHLTADSNLKMVMARNNTGGTESNEDHDHDDDDGQHDEADNEPTFDFNTVL